MMETSRERMIVILSDIIDPEAFATISISSDKSVDERARIRARQIVAQERARQVIDRLLHEFPSTLGFLRRSEDDEA